MLISRTIVALSIAAFALPASASPPTKGKGPAASNAEAEALATKAVERFKAKDFDAAAKLFMQAYAKSHTPALVFNAARAYEDAGKAGDAASLFKLYITISEDADGILDARERIQRLEGKQAKAEPQTIEAKPAVVIQAKPEPAPDAPDTTLKWGVTGTAAAAVVGGVALLLVGRSNSNSANGMAVRDEAGLQAYNNQYDRAQLQWRAGAGVVAAGVLLAGWATWLHMKRPAVAKHAQLWVDPAGVQLAVRF
jgi:hypothetical protein